MRLCRSEDGDCNWGLLFRSDDVVVVVVVVFFFKQKTAYEIHR